MRELRQILNRTTGLLRRQVAEFFQRNTEIARADLPDLLDQLQDFTNDAIGTLPPIDFHPAARKLDLAAPLGMWHRLPRTLANILRARRSNRTFGARPLTDREIATLLTLAYGRIDHDGRALSTVPSAGALYPLHLYLIARRTGLPRAVWHYHFRQGRLARIHDLPSTDADAECPAIMRAGVVAVAPLDLVITTRGGETLTKYGDRGLRYLLFECGHLAQNIALVAESLDLNTVALGGFYDRELSDWLRLDPAVEQPQYVIAVGPR